MASSNAVSFIANYSFIYLLLHHEGSTLKQKQLKILLQPKLRRNTQHIQYYKSKYATVKTMRHISKSYALSEFAKWWP